MSFTVFHPILLRDGYKEIVKGKLSDREFWTLEQIDTKLNCSLEKPRLGDEGNPNPPLGDEAPPPAALRKG